MASVQTEPRASSTDQRERSVVAALIRQALAEQWTVGETLYAIAEQFDGDSVDDAIFRIVWLACQMDRDARAWLQQHVPWLAPST